MIKKYLEYLRYNPEGYWFKRKIYGWGWTPAKWQGWAVMLIFIALISIDALILDSSSQQTTTDLVLFFTKIILNVAILILICYKTGEKPKWQWGGE